MRSYGPKTNTVAVVSAHVGDFCIRAGGTLALYAARGWRTEAICLSFGERGESPGCWDLGLSEPDTKGVRRKEAEAAASVLGAHVEFADWGDQPLTETPERMGHLVDWLRRVQPGILLAHFPSDPWNPDHEVAHKMTRDASYFATRAGVPGRTPTSKPHMYYFEPTWPFAGQADFSPNVYVDITDSFETKMAAVKLLVSQPGIAERYHSLATVRAGEACEGQALDIRYAEAFFRVSPWVGGLLPSGNPWEAP